MENPYQSSHSARESIPSDVQRTREPPGWLAATVAVVALLYPVAYTYVYFVAAAGAPQLVQQVVYGGGKALQFALPLLWVGWLWLRWGGGAWRNVQGLLGRHMEGPRHPGGSNMPAKPLPPGRSLAIGVGFAVLTVLAIGLIGGLWLLPAGYFDLAGREIRVKLAQFGVTTPLRYALMGVYYCVVHSFLEEYYWRWFAFRLVRRFVPLTPAALLQGIAFAAHHLLVLGFYFGWTSPLTWLTAGSVAVGGTFWAWLYERSGRLWIAWLSHLLIDVGVFAMGYRMFLAPA